MSKEIKASELLEMLKNKTIQKGSRLKLTNVINKNTAIAKVLDNPNKYVLENEDTRNALAANWLIGTKIELIEDNKIDIDNIQEYNEYFIEQSNTTEDVKSLARKINELVQAVKQLNKEVQELKSK